MPSIDLVDEKQTFGYEFLVIGAESELFQHFTQIGRVLLSVHAGLPPSFGEYSAI